MLKRLFFHWFLCNNGIFSSQSLTGKLDVQIDLIKIIVKSNQVVI